MKKNSFAYRVFDLYYDGFRNMRLGRTLWLVIAIKLFIMFAILRLFFFPNFIKENAKKGEEPEFVASEVVGRAADNGATVSDGASAEAGKATERAATAE